MAKRWSCIVITCPSSSSVDAIKREIEYMQKENRLYPEVDVLAIEDPAENIGSGAATLNALVIATEFLSVQQDYMVVTADVLSDAYILILLHGRDYLYNSCGKPFIAMPSDWFSKGSLCTKAGDYVTSLEVLFNFVNELQCNSLPGVWVCSTDMLLLTHKKVVRNCFERIPDAVMFCVPSDMQYAANHGTVHIDEQGYIEDIIYCGSKETIEKYRRSDGSVPLVSGIVYLSTSVAESLLSLHLISPLDSCTYMGLDSGADPIQVSLFFDILVAMATKVSRDDFLSGRCGKVYNIKVGFNKGCLKMNRARSLVWEELSKYKMTSEILEDCQHIYWSDRLPGKNHVNNLFSIMCSTGHNVSEINGNFNDPGSIFVNSIIESDKSCNISSGTVMCHSNLKLNECQIGKNCYLSGITPACLRSSSLVVPDDTVVLGFCLSQVGSFSVVVFGVHDDPLASVYEMGSTFANRPWSHLFTTFEIKENNLWSSSTGRKNRNLMNAKLYPQGSTVEDVLWLVQGNVVDSHHVQRWKASKKLSLSEIIQSVSHSHEFNFQRKIYVEIISKKVKKVLLNNEDEGLLKYFHAACAENWHYWLLSSLDSVLELEKNTVVLTRTLSCMADLLGTMAGKIGGLRSGPGGNKSWAAAFDHLQKGDVVAGMKALREERMKWTDRPDRLMRAARHYERAAQILIQNSVKTARAFMNFNSCPVPEMNEWVIVECPARVDLQGGWTDTPPMCYELGGSVVNIAVLVDGKKPIGAKAQRIRAPSIILKIGLDKLSPEIVVIEDIKDLLDYDQPNAQGALVKAAIICTNIVNVKSDLPLWEQLLKKLNGGIELHSWSRLPQGCGMGGSSILAGAIVAVLMRVSGKAIDNSAILHVVLEVEQLLTTGGGWQDQVGGLMGGINRGYSDASLPLHVKVKPIPVSPSFVGILNRHLLLIDTGKVRLAKNLLQNVIRNWYARDETIVNCFKELQSSSLQLEEALKKGDLKQIGSLMNTYWKLKKVLAPGCEPASVKDLMSALDPLCYGQLLAGAGGGGFMCILTKKPDDAESVKGIISNLKSNQRISVHRPTICFKGLMFQTVED